MQVFQTPFELERVSELCRALKPARVLEVGAWDGGTLVEWMRAHPETVVVVDDRMRAAPTWARWAEESGIELHLIPGRSESRDVIDAVEQHAPFDWVFIDGGHTYEEVRSDWASFSPMVRPGGAVAFHDIWPRVGYGVSLLWAEIKAVGATRWMEIQQTPTGTVEHNGIGVVWL